MESTLRQSCANIRQHEQTGTPLVLLHIGADTSWVATGTGTEAEQLLMLELGSTRTSGDFFRHHPPSPLEMENAIMVVEDEVTRARSLALEGALLFSADELLHELARVVGCPDGLVVTLNIEQVGRLFNQLAARSEGRPSTQVDLPDDRAVRAGLLILREFMHHLHFDDIRLRRMSPPPAMV